MKIQIRNKTGVAVAHVTSDSLLIQDVQSALDVLMTVQHETQCERMIVSKSAVCEAFFCLSNGMAGEILQKFVNYQIKLAIVGDFSRYASKPLRDFIYESNKGRDIFFVSTESEAVDKLSRA